VSTRHESVQLERLTLGETVRLLAFEPERLDVLVVAGVMARAVEDLAADDAAGRRLAASARLSGNGPAVFAPAPSESAHDAGHGVVDPASMLLAVSLLLREGLGEAHAADTLVAALRRARTDAPAPALAASTRDFGDAVVSLLPSSHRNAEFVRESAA
jgi:3-isopropylmalate dehydrogenase